MQLKMIIEENRTEWKKVKRDYHTEESGWDMKYEAAREEKTRVCQREEQGTEVNSEVGIPLCSFQ